MTEGRANADAHALVDLLLGAPDRAADRAVAILHAHAAALAWVRDSTGGYPAPPSVADRLTTAAERLRTGEDPGDPVAVLRRAAEAALATYQMTGAR